MKASNHHQVLVHTIFLVLLICQIPQEVIAYPSEYQNQHHEVDLRSSSHHGHHGIGVSLIRSKRDATITCTRDADCTGIKNSYCQTDKKRCDCPINFSKLDRDNNICVNGVKLDSQCEYNSECEEEDVHSYCGEKGEEKKCICKDNYIMEEHSDDSRYNMCHLKIADKKTTDSGTSKTGVTSVIIISLILLTYLG